jgi:hypothetical protein
LLTSANVKVLSRQIMVHKLIHIWETWHDSLLTRVCETDVIKI